MPEEIEPVLRERLAQEADVSAAVLFGSAARGNLRPDSDLDVAILWRSPASGQVRERRLLTLTGELGLLCGREIHLLDLEHMEAPVRRSALTDGRMLIERDVAAMRALRLRTAIECVDWEHARAVIDRGLDARLAKLRHG